MTPPKRPYHDLSAREMLPYRVPKLATKAVSIRKLYEVFGRIDIDPGEQVDPHVMLA
jgi:hypothetical protein